MQDSSAQIIRIVHDTQCTRYLFVIFPSDQWSNLNTCYIILTCWCWADETARLRTNLCVIILFSLQPKFERLLRLHQFFDALCPIPLSALPLHDKPRQFTRLDRLLLPQNVLYALGLLILRELSSQSAFFRDRCSNVFANTVQVWYSNILQIQCRSGTLACLENTTVLVLQYVFKHNVGQALQNVFKHTTGQALQHVFAYTASFALQHIHEWIIITWS